MLFLVVCLAGSGPARAQVAAGEITGVVKDQAGAAIPGVTVTVTSVATNLQRSVVTTADGVYAAPSLAPGEYRVRVELPGFKPIRRGGLKLSTGQKARLDFTMAVGDIREEVTIVGDVPIMRAETAGLGTVIGHEQVVQLPRINGGRPRTNEYLFDGSSVLQPEPGQVAYFPVIDAVQEFKIESNSPPAEFGRFNGGVVNLTTKSGTNALTEVCSSFFAMRV